VTIAFFLYAQSHGKFALVSLPFSNTIISLSVLFLMSSYLTPSDKLVFKLLNNKFMVHLGVLSYSVYVWQQFFIVGTSNAYWRIFPLNVLFIYLVALSSYYFWERPWLRLKSKIDHGRLPLGVMDKA
jgi:peptidoglycan/LPS O-acetylase OafA/YrhL